MEILWGLATLASGTLLAGWLSMRIEKRHDVALIFFLLGPIPLVIVDVGWSLFGAEGLGVRLIVSGLVGAFAGACILMGTTESLRAIIKGANAQTSLPTDTRTEILMTQPMPPVTPSLPSGPKIGTDTTIIGPVPAGGAGDRSTIVGQPDPDTGAALRRGGTAIGAGAQADSTGVAVGAGAKAGPNSVSIGSGAGPR